MMPHVDEENTYIKEKSYKVDWRSWRDGPMPNSTGYPSR